MPHVVCHASAEQARDGTRRARRGATTVSGYPARVDEDRELLERWRAGERAAGEALGKKGAPVDAAIVGIIDQVSIDGDL